MCRKTWSPGASFKNYIVVLIVAILLAAETAHALNIRDVQGDRHVSSANFLVLTDANRVQGIVTKIVNSSFRKGFFIQEVDDSSDPFLNPRVASDRNKSRAVFVCLDRDPTSTVDRNTGDFARTVNAYRIGDLVSVRGQVVDGFTSTYGSGDNRRSLQHCGNTTFPLTQIIAPCLARLSTCTSEVILRSRDNALPAAIVLGRDGISPPGDHIYQTFPTGVTSLDLRSSAYVLRPELNAIDFWESLEGMRVQINDPKITSPTATFGSNDRYDTIHVGVPGIAYETSRGGAVLREGKKNTGLLAVLAHNGTMPRHPIAKVGDITRLVGGRPLTGVLSYDFFYYDLIPDGELEIVAGITEPEVTTLLASENELTVAAFNVENLLGTEPQSKFDGLARQIVINLGAPDIIALSEMGAERSGGVRGSATAQKLIDAISKIAPDIQYAYRQIDPIPGREGGAPGVDIRAAFLFNPARVQFIDRPLPACPSADPNCHATIANDIEFINGAPRLKYNPGRVDPNNLAFSSPKPSRRPLAGEFMFRGEIIFLIANHWSSKSEDQDEWSRYQPAQLLTEPQRDRQAVVVRDFVQRILNLDARANILVLGDLNDFQFSKPLNTLKSTQPSLKVLADDLPEAERYTYIFAGSSQTLDHIVASEGIYERGIEYDIVHMNAEFSKASGIRHSDHDAPIARINFAEPLTWQKLKNGISGAIALQPESEKGYSLQASLYYRDAGTRFDQLVITNTEGFAAVYRPPFISGVGYDHHAPAEYEVWEASNGQVLLIQFPRILMSDDQVGSALFAVPVSKEIRAGRNYYRVNPDWLQLWIGDGKVIEQYRHLGSASLPADLAGFWGDPVE